MNELRRPRVVFPAIAALTVAAVVIAAGALAGGQGPPTATLTILSKEGRRPLPLIIVNDQELLYLDDLASAFQLSVREESLGTLTVAYKSRTILLTPDQPLVSVAGRLVSLPASPTRSGRRVMVPVEFINRALALIYDARLDLRKPARLLIVGDLRIPRVSVRFETGDPAHLIVDATPRTASALSQEGNSLAIKFEAEALDVVLPPIQPQPLIQAIRVVEPTTLLVDLGPRFGTFRATTQQLDTTTRMTIDLVPSQSDQPPVAAVAPGPPAPSTMPPLDLSALGAPVSAIRTIAIDPGHGGEDEGVKGAGGTKEKDLTLAVARRVKATIESRLGIRVLLTRDDDHNVSLDGRAAMANNNKADVFISLHVNASFRKNASGASILYAAFDGEGDLAARASLGQEKLPTFGGGLRDIDLVQWDLAQIRHIERSGELAMILVDQFRDHIPLSVRPIDRAALRVLVSANMPAVMLEMGYLSNEGQEKLLAGPEFQNALVQGVYDAVVKFRDLLAGGTQ